jgi:GDP-D-mannose dehydratase
MTLSRIEAIPELHTLTRRCRAYRVRTSTCLVAAKLLEKKKETPVVPLAPYADVKEVGPPSL